MTSKPSRPSSRPLERTLILVKPDGVARRLVGAILERFEQRGLKIAALKMMNVDAGLAERHYGVHKDRPFYAGLIRFITAGPVVAMVLEGPRVVEVTRKMMGATFGWKAEAGTIRGDHGISNSFNLIHGSDSPESAAKEIALFFQPDEILSYELPGEAWVFDRAEDAGEK
ncbi:MAG: nucleoside-diphosphate kinase [Planctomycetes bacterium]|nr:nucleoside-diphosphate kinase [Planctomycetota bacterium]MBI3846780.1 nucleoside-diphosphate kinase [Planctomycetota bacterium]